MNNPNIDTDTLYSLQRTLTYLQEYQWQQSDDECCPNYVTCPVCTAKFVVYYPEKWKHQKDCQLMLDIGKLKCFIGQENSFHQDKIMDDFNNPPHRNII